MHFVALAAPNKGIQRGVKSGRPLMPGVESKIMDSPEQCEHGFNLSQWLFGTMGDEFQVEMSKQWVKTEPSVLAI